jgi:hypothetical protein
MTSKHNIHVHGQASFTLWRNVWHVEFLANWITELTMLTPEDTHRDDFVYDVMKWEQQRQLPQVTDDLSTILNSINFTVNTYMEHRT